MPAHGPHDHPLSPRQEAGLSALLAQPTIAKAAASSGINERTLRRWLGQPAFAAALRRARREAFALSASLAQHYAGAAVQQLARVMVDGGAPHAARVSAATALLKFGRESIELDDLAGRVEDLERAAAEQRAEQGVRKWA